MRAFAPTQDHRPEQLRQPGAEVAAGDPREIPHAESWGEAARQTADRPSG